METLLQKIGETIFDPWVLLGLFGQFIFFSRVLIQWIASEKKKSIVIPISYWYFSIVGAIILLVYSFHTGDVVFIIAYILNVLIFSRSLVIQMKDDERKKKHISFE
jgi:lipid-A-disaccharide synthase-like uncharacterized protein